METESREMPQLNLDSFHVSETLGFVLDAPLTDLPDYYRVWMVLANNLSHLVDSHKLQDLVDEIPVFGLHHLTKHKELRLAHLVLGFISSGYVWQEGCTRPAKVLPKALALPYYEVSRLLGLPPIVTYSDGILANWKLKDPTKGLELGNLDVICSFPGKMTCEGFFLVSLLVDIAASSGLTGTLEVVNAMKISDLTGIEKGLIKVTKSLKKMKETFKLMHDQVDPTEFYGIIRVFLSGWRDNPALPQGLVYEGVSDEPIFLSGGNGSQSSTIQCFDALLDIKHGVDNEAFLTRMRDYMLPAHRQLIETLSACPSLRSFILSHSNSDLCSAYNSCVSALVDLRCYHVNIVTKYVVVPGNKDTIMGCPLGDAGLSLKNIGTGGSSVINFLKSVRNSAKEALIIKEAN